MRAAGECRIKRYATESEALRVVFSRDDNCVAYRCFECNACHVSALSRRGDDAAAQDNLEPADEAGLSHGCVEHG